MSVSLPLYSLYASSEDPNQKIFTMLDFSRKKINPDAYYSVCIDNFDTDVNGRLIVTFFATALVKMKGEELIRLLKDGYSFPWRKSTKFTDAKCAIHRR